MDFLIFGPTDVYEYECEKCGATKVIKVSGEGRKTYIAEEDLLCGFRGCLGGAMLRETRKVRP